MFNQRVIYNAILACLILSSCAPDQKFESLDNQLTDAIVRASSTSSLEEFIFPDSDSYDQIPQDPLNPITAEKVILGKNLFHETAFGTKGVFDNSDKTFSCASCHHAAAGFQAGIAQGIGEGGMGFGMQGEGRKLNQECEPELVDVQPIRSPSILNGAYQELMLWNGQFGANGMNIGTESQWTDDTPKAVNHLGFEGLETQAIAGLAVHRTEYNEDVIVEFGYKEMFDKAFPSTNASERYTQVTAGLAIAAYERTVMANKSNFQQYLKGNLEALTEAEKQGALVFFQDGNCVSCHKGPALNAMEFHALGFREFDQDNVFFYNPDDPTKFGRYSFTQEEEDRYKFKTPQLYNLKDVEFLGHGATFHTVRQIVDYKNKAIAENPHIPKNRLSDQFVPLGLSTEEVTNLTLFIENALYDNNLDRYVPDVLPSGYCFPNNDIDSQIDLGCQ